jgi:DNA-binding NarL/FixJ family response regulator
MSEPVPEARPRVVVVSELTLVAEAVSASLAGHDLETTTMRWPDDHSSAWRGTQRGYRQGIGLMINDLDSWSHLRGAWRLIAEIPLSWVVLTSTPHGPMWGAALEAGAVVVMPGDADLAAVHEVIVGVAAGNEQIAPSERALLTSTWADLLDRLELIGKRIHSLTPREHEVLTMLHAGHPVASIAQLLEVSPATVRSQVKSVLRKLEVSTQLAAVAALDDLIAWQRTGPVEVRS